MKYIDQILKLILGLLKFFKKPDPAATDNGKLSPIDKLKGDKLYLRATKYYLALESEYSINDRHGVFKDVNNKVIHKGSTAFKRAADIEGSAKLRDGRVLNFWKRVAGEIRYKVLSDAPFGLGAQGYPLIPLKSVAVDKKIIPLGSKLYIKKFDGRVFSGVKHDGIFYAHDVGSAIKGDRIDLMTGAGKKSLKSVSFIQHMEALEVIVLK